MANTRPPPPPPAPLGFTRDQYREYAETLTLDELLIASKAFAHELKAREGKLKYQPTIPPRQVN